MNTFFRILLVLWILGFIVVSCVPILSGDIGAGLVGLIAGSVLLIPWLIGVLILGVLVWLTSSRGG